MISVPQFGGWDQNAPEANSYTIMFARVRSMKRHQKINLTEIRHVSLDDEGDFVNANNHGQAHHVSRRGRAHPVSMGKKRILAYLNCCIRP
uniref:RIN4 pathogenic type III effector avirulence factor Avr cleavage site domain-containing protein n=1 Tax=Cajanus cajan TaxID=3821 RepID=A0A151U1W8_CAJCA|nr:hypothetical protein KK1_005860 [Cajanus cajan]